MKIPCLKVFCKGPGIRNHVIGSVGDCLFRCVLIVLNTMMIYSSFPAVLCSSLSESVVYKIRRLYVQVKGGVTCGSGPQSGQDPQTPPERGSQVYVGLRHWSALSLSLSQMRFYN